LVVTSTIVERAVASSSSFIATVRPLRRAIVGSAVSGRVVEFLSSGDTDGQRVMRVREGQLLAQLKTDSMEIDLAAAKAEQRLLEQALTELTNGALPEEKAQASAQKLSARAKMRFARAKYERTKRLFTQSKTASREELDLALAEAVQAEQSFADASANYDLVLAGPRAERLAQARARLEAQVEAVRRMQVMLDKHAIMAPFDGYVVNELTEVGSWLKTGDPVAEVVQLDVVELEAFIAERHVVHVRKGMLADVRIDALPGRKFPGIVARVIPQADERSRTFPVRIRVNNPEDEDGHLLKSGMSAKVNLGIGDIGTALMVPKDALVLGAERPRIVVVQQQAEGPTVQMVDVELGMSDSEWIQISGPVQDGMEVVVQGNERLRAGQRVEVTERVSLNGL
jgi:multidrug efflux pump subunit AcrA (membrane-fusion protein)